MNYPGQNTQNTKTTRPERGSKSSRAMSGKEHGNTGRRNAAKPETEKATARLSVRCKIQDRVRWQEVAKSHDASMAEWINRTLNHCASPEYQEKVKQGQ